MLDKPNNILMHIGLFISLFFLGFIEPASGIYSFLSSIFSDQPFARITLHIFSSAFILIYCLKSHLPKILLSCNLSKFLGRISFPLYVIHVPLLFSLSSFLFIELQPMGRKSALLITLVLSMLTCILLARILARVDEAWCRLINKIITGSIQKRLPNEAPL